MAEVVIHQPNAPEDRVRSSNSLRWICGGKCENGTGIFPSNWIASCQ